MKDLFFLFAHLITTLVKLAQPSGLRAVVAELLALKHQLLAINRSRQPAPRLTPWDRLLLGFYSLFIPIRRLGRIAAILKPATLLKLHRHRVHSSLGMTPQKRGGHDSTALAILDGFH